FHHKTAPLLLRQYDTIHLEDLRVATMVRNKHLAKSISHAGWAAFRTILAGKAASTGPRVVAVPPAYTSQECSGCGERAPKSLSVRTHVCPNCGLVLDRDENAARTIQWAGQALRGLAGGACRDEPRSPLPVGMGSMSPQVVRVLLVVRHRALDNGA